MATIHDLPQPDFFELTKEQALLLIRQRRDSRRVSKALGRVAAGSTKSVKRLATKFTSSQLAQLIREIEENLD